MHLIVYVLGSLIANSHYLVVIFAKIITKSVYAANWQGGLISIRCLEGSEAFCVDSMFYFQSGW